MAQLPAWQTTSWSVVLGLLLLGLPAPADQLPDPDTAPVPSRRWVGPDGQSLPFRNDAEILDFLITAEPVSERTIDQGINRPLKLLLEKDGVRAHAIFRSVDTSLGPLRPGRKGMPHVRDSHMFERAAFELSRMLAIDRVPPVVERSHNGVPGTLQLWIEQAIDEGTRSQQNLQPPGLQRRIRQRTDQVVFDSLIDNFDRNQGNLLIDRDGNLWLIDHTRTFSPDSRLENPRTITRCTRSLFERLRQIDRQLVRETLDPYLTDVELRALLHRWDELVALLALRINKLGEDVVLLDESSS